MMFLKKLTNGILDRRYWCLCVIDGFGFAANGHRQPKQWKYFFLVPALANCAFLFEVLLSMYICMSMYRYTKPEAKLDHASS